MKKSTRLFHLIKSLTMSEKRYFKIYSSLQSGDKVYLKLFRAIDKQENYDEAAIRKMYHKELFVKQLSLTKIYLYNLILKSLSVDHSGISEDAMIMKHLRYVEILYKKKLYDQGADILSKAKRLAYYYENHILLMEILKQERQLMRENNFRGISGNDLEKHYQEESRTLARINNVREYRHLLARFYIHYKKEGHARDPDQLKKFKTIMENPLLKDENKAIGYEGKNLFYLIKGSYYYIISDYENAQLYTNKRVKLIEAYPDKLKRNVIVYLTAINNLIVACINLKKFDQCLYLTRKLRSLPERLKIKQTRDLEVEIFGLTYSNETDIYIKSGHFIKGLALIKPVERGLTKYGDIINDRHKICCHYNITYLYFGAQQYKKSLQQINTILNDPAMTGFVDIYSSARLLNLLIHYELGHNDLVENFINSAKRFLKKKSRFYQLEYIVLKMMVKLSKNPEKEQMMHVLKSAKNEMLVLTRDVNEIRVFDYFDFISWLESKIENRSFADIVREKTTSYI